MGNLEVAGKRRARRRNIRDVLLGSIKAAALAGIVITAPNVFGSLKKLGIIGFGKKDAGVIGRTRRQLIREGYITVERGLIRITAKGNAELQRLEARAALQKKPRRWDGRWRVLILHMPDYRKSTRNRIRRTLIAVGFMRLQDSVWIYPYDCEDFIVLLKADFKIGKDVLYMIVDELEADKQIRKRFGLKSS